jgi:23S rRNA (cytidine1920-2'-O)/16S rRNA (cytidine1409-2'-O)-methyltransferase
VRRRLAPSRQAARLAVESGRVRVNGLPAAKPASLVAADASVQIVGEPPRFVSRGGDKLDAGLTAFGISVEGARCFDAGASTGGFTDCLLQRGAKVVVAVDVGYGQFDWTLRQDDRVILVERTNVRTIDPSDFGAPFDLVVADLSFISLTTVVPALAGLGTVATDYVLLVKPQFEVGQANVGKGGVVLDPVLHRSSIEKVAAAMGAAGYPAAGVVPSPLLGPAGNREFLLWCADGGDIGPSAIGKAVEA